MSSLERPLNSLNYDEIEKKVDALIGEKNNSIFSRKVIFPNMFAPSGIAMIILGALYSSFIFCPIGMLFMLFGPITYSIKIKS